MKEAAGSSRGVPIGATLLICSAVDPLHALRDEMQRVANRLMPELQVRLWPQPFSPEDVVAVAAWHPPPGLLSTLPNLRLISSIGAGAEHLLTRDDLPQDVPITRIVDPEQARGMGQYVLWCALHFHRGFDHMREQQAKRRWLMPAQTPAAGFQVGIMGLGGMGQTTALMLRDAGYQVSGWSRTEQHIAGVHCLAGDANLIRFLAPLDLVVCLLPLTPATHGLCNTRFFAQLKPGAAFVNAGRGEHVVMPDLLSALDSGELRGAVLDVFEQEPLRTDSPLWSHPGLVITPHMASSASDEVIAWQVVENVVRTRKGLAPAHGVDRERAY